MGVTKDYMHSEIKNALSVLKKSNIKFDAPTEEIDKFCEEQFEKINPEFEFPKTIEEAKSAIFSTAKIIGLCGVNVVSNKSKPAMCNSLKKINDAFRAFAKEYSKDSAKQNVIKNVFPQMDSELVANLYSTDGEKLNGVHGNRIYAAEKGSIDKFVNSMVGNLDLLVEECKGIKDYDVSHLEL